MALASCEVKVMSRGKGKSAVAAAAYRSGKKLSNEREGKTYDYSHKRNIAHTEILVPANAPEWAKDRSKLWNEVEQTETRCNSRTAREIRIALPCELTLQQNIALARDYAQTFVKQGMIADFAIHYDKGNPHCHIMLTTRAITPEGFSKKIRAWDKQERIPEWRKEYETVTNKHLELADRPEHINADSYEKQGIEKIPTIHLGHYSHEKEQRGEHTIRGDRNRAIEEQNRQIEQANKEIELVKQALRREQEAAQLEQQRQQQLEEHRQQEANRQRAEAERERQRQQEAAKQEAMREAQRREVARQQETERQRQQAERQRAAEQQRQQEATRHEAERRRAAQEQEAKRHQQEKEEAHRMEALRQKQDAYHRQKKRFLQRPPHPQRPASLGEPTPQNRRGNKPLEPTTVDWKALDAKLQAEKRTLEDMAREQQQRQGRLERLAQDDPKRANWAGLRQSQEEQRIDWKKKEQQRAEQRRVDWKQEAERQAARQQPPPPERRKPTEPQQPPPSEYMKKWQQRVQDRRENKPDTEPEHHDRPQSEYMRKWQERVREYRHHKPERHIEREHEHDRERWTSNRTAPFQRCIYAPFRTYTASSIDTVRQPLDRLRRGT